MTSDLSIANAPRSIAVIGASDKIDKLGGRCLHYLQRFGFQGGIYPVNPTRKELCGLKCYPDLKSLPDVAELAVIAVPGDQAIEAVRSCAEGGTRVAVILTSGFGETDAAGKDREQIMVQVARQHGMRLIGPNTQGLSNFANGVIANFSTMFIETTPADGPVGIVSQSGGGASVPFGLLRERGVGVRYCHSIGNQCDVSVSELALTLVPDPDLRLLLLYLEGIPSAREVAELGRAARERELPVLVVKSGRSSAGQKASLSHTGSLATEDRVVDAFLAHHGLHRVADAGQLVAAADLYLKGWKPTGRRLAVISNSGTACVMTADAGVAHGLRIEEFSPETQAALSQVLPAFATKVNPVDITAALLSNSRLFGDILPIIAKDPGADLFVISVPVAGQGYDVEAFARDTASFAAMTGKPTVVAAPQPKVAARFRDAGIPVFVQESDAVAALAQFTAAFETLERARRFRDKDEVWEQQCFQKSSLGRVRNEVQSLAWAASVGIPVVPHRLCHDSAGAVAAANDIGGYVAVKGCTTDATHKSELGLVRLHLQGADEVSRACAEIEANAARHGVRLDGLVVEQMVKARFEMLVGAHVDPTFGPVLTLGQGGKYVEAMPDTRVLMAGASRQEIREAIKSLRIAAVLGGVRGEPPADVEALCDVVYTLGQAMCDPARRVYSVDFNPILLLDEGQGCMAVDGVIIEMAQLDGGPG